jgi:hypothetical protein
VRSSLGHTDVWLANYVKTRLARTFVLARVWTQVARSGLQYPLIPTYSPTEAHAWGKAQPPPQ